MKKAGLEFKLGVFVLVSIAVLIGLVLKTGDFSLKPGYTVRFIFGFVSGIDNGSPVRLAGVNVGEVKEIRVVRNAQAQTQVEIISWIEQGAYIEEDAEVRINSLGLLGEKYVEILPGTSGAKTLGDGGTLIGKTPVVMEKVTESGNRLINKIELTMDSINEVVADPEFRKTVRGAFRGADRFTNNLMQVSEDLKESSASARIVLARLRDGEGTIGRLLTNDAIAKDIEAMVKDLKAHPWKLFKKS